MSVVGFPYKSLYLLLSDFHYEYYRKMCRLTWHECHDGLIIIIISSSDRRASTLFKNRLRTSIILSFFLNRAHPHFLGNHIGTRIVALMESRDTVSPDPDSFASTEYTIIVCDKRRPTTHIADAHMWLWWCSRYHPSKWVYVTCGCQFRAEDVPKLRSRQATTN